MAQNCIGCGLISDPVTGLLKVHIDPAGGITCGVNGLSAAGVSGSAAAAMAAAVAAQSTADTANNTANNALTNAGIAQTAIDTRVPNKIRWGRHDGSINVAGDTVFAHGLGGVPASVVVTAVGAGANIYNFEIQAIDAVNVNVRSYNSTTGATAPIASVAFYWFAAL